MPQTALITGASGGLGYEFANIFAQKKYNLILVSRNTRKLATIQRSLEKEYGVSVVCIPKDLTGETAAQEIHQAVLNRNLTVDVLVNNAGFGMHGAYTDIPLSEILEELHVNIRAVAVLTKLFLPGMLGRKSGSILNIASTGAFQPGPYFAVYDASKAFILSFSQALSEELKGTGVTVTTLCPGATRTGFFARANMAGSALIKRAMHPAAVARIGYQSLKSRKQVVIAGIKNNIVVAITAWFPYAWMQTIIDHAQKWSARILFFGLVSSSALAFLTE